MKKLLALLISVILVFSLSVAAFATGETSSDVTSSTESSDSTSSGGETTDEEEDDEEAVVTTGIVLSVESAKHGDHVNVSVMKGATDTFKSLGLEFTFDDAVFEIVSGNWNESIDSLLADFNTKDKKAALAAAKAVDFTGEIFTLSLRVKDGATVGSSKIDVNILAKSSTTVVLDTNASATVAVSCAEHKFSEWTTTTAATCTTAGEETRKCTTAGCEETETKSVIALGHAYGDAVITREPTCTYAGIETKTCSRCGHESLKDIPALGHKFSDPVVTKEPTCTEEGEETGTCTVCSQTTSNKLAAKGHTFGEWTDKVAATCTEDGSQERVCSVCQATETQEVKATGHKFKDPTIVKEPTISSTGLMSGKCESCDEATEQKIPCTAKDETTGIVVEAEEGVFASGTELKFSVISISDPNYNPVKNAVSVKGGSFAAYEIGFAKGDAAVEANGDYTLIIPIKDGMSKDDISACFIGKDGVLVEKVAVVNEDGTISVKADDAGIYAIVDESVAAEPGDGNVDTDAPVTDPKPDKQPDNGEDEESEGNGEDNMIWVIVLIAIAVIVGAIAMIAFIVKKR